MAESMRDIKRRIKSVNSTKQITHAMELVSSAKLRRLRQKADARRAYTTYVIESMHKIAVNIENPIHPLLKENEANKDLYIVIAADKGLAGGFNSNLLKFSVQQMQKSENAVVVALGLETLEFFKRTGTEIIASYIGKSEHPTPEFGREVGKYATELFTKGEVGNVYIVFNRFMSVISQKPSIVKLLPLAGDDLTNRIDEVDSSRQEGNTEAETNDKQIIDTQPLMSYEPNADELLDYLIPRYIDNTIYGACLETSAGEQAARRMAMENATDNAQEMIDGLTLRYNRARQGAITQELTEIVNGAQALE